MERRLHLRRRTRSASPRHDQGDRADRDASSAAFEMDEILYELRDHSAGLQRRALGLHLQRRSRSSASRADSCCPTARQVTMTVPFMRAYTELLVKTCHRRGAHAMGGMAAFIPSRARRRGQRASPWRASSDDKQREASDGFDGTWVAHPDLVPIAHGGLRRRARRDGPTSSTGSAPTSTVDGRRPARLRVDAAATITEAGAAHQRQRRHPVHRVVAARHRRGGASST